MHSLPGRPEPLRVLSYRNAFHDLQHGLDPGPLRGVLGPADWDGFLAGQRATVRQRQRDVELRDLRLSNLRECLRVSRRRRSPRWIRWR